MNKLRAFYRKNKLLIKILSSYFIIGFILLSIFSYILIYTYSQKSLEEVTKASENMISQSYYTADILLTNIYYNYYQLYANDIDKDITSILYTKELDQFVAYDVLRKLGQHLDTQPLIRSIYLYNSKANIVVYRIAKDEYGTRNIKNFFDQDMIQMLKEPDKLKTDLYFTRKINYIQSEREVSENLTTLILTNAVKDREVESAIVININQNMLQQMLTQGNIGDQYQIFLMNQNGEVITHSDNSMIDQDIGKYEYIKRIIESEEKKGNFTSKINGKDSLVTFIKADRLRWIFVSTGEYSKILSNANLMQRNIMVLTIIFICIGLILAGLFASSIYNPFQRLLKDIRKRYLSKNKNEFLDVYDYLKYTFNELVNDVGRYKLDSHQLINKKKSEMLKKIVNGELDYGMDDLQIMETYGIDFDSSFFLVLIIRINSFAKQIEEMWSKDGSIFKFAVLNIFCEHLGDRFKTEGIDNGTDFVSIILNTSSKSYFDKKMINETILEIQSNTEKYLKCEVTVGVGEMVQGVEHINDSFQAAMTAVQYRLIFGRRAVIWYEEIKERNTNFYEYPDSIENNIVDALKKFNLDKLEEELIGFFSYIKGFDVYEIQLSITQLLLILAKTISKMMETKEELGPYNFKAMNLKLENCETLQEIEEYFFSLCSNALEVIRHEPKNSKKLVLVNRIKEYIQKHYKEQDLSTDSIAEYVDLSVNYIRTIFKEIAKISIAEYITNCRIEEAKRLLLETDLTVKMIAEVIGYSDKYFYVVFKKYMDKTPEEYRSIENQDQ